MTDIYQSYRKAGNNIYWADQPEKHLIGMIIDVEPGKCLYGAVHLKDLLAYFESHAFTKEQARKLFNRDIPYVHGSGLFWTANGHAIILKG